MSDRLKLALRLFGGLILASVGLSLGYILIYAKNIGPLWCIPFACVLAAASIQGFIFIRVYRIERDQ